MLDITSTIRNRLTSLNASLSLLATLAGISKTLLNDAVNGRARLGIEAERHVDAVLRDLERFAESLSPVRPDFRDARLVAEWLDEFREKRAKISKSVTADAFVLLAELAELAGDATLDTVLERRGWTRGQLVEHLVRAQDEIRQMRTQLAAYNDGAQARL